MRRQNSENNLIVKIGKLSKSSGNGTVYLEDSLSSISQISAKVRLIKGSAGRRIYLGIDPGISPLTISAITVDDYGLDVWSIAINARKTAEGNDWRDRYLRVTSVSECVGLILKILKPRKPYVCIEGYSFQSARGAAYTLAEIKQSVLEKLCAYTKGFEKVLLLPPPTWKACLCPKKGGASKELIQECIIREYPPSAAFGKDHNKYDSFAMAYVYLMLCAGRLTTKSAESLIDREHIETDVGLEKILRL